MLRVDWDGDSVIIQSDRASYAYVVSVEEGENGVLMGFSVESIA